MPHTVYLRKLDIAPRKTRVVADTVRGLSVNEAEARLLNQTKRAAEPLLKLLRSAKAGAAQKDLNPDTLYIQSIQVDQGEMLKRYMPRARGSASMIQKKMSHIKLVLGENPHAKPPRFTIAVKQKKSKAHPDEAAPKRRKKAPEEGERDSTPQGQNKQGGFFKRTFNRKAGTGK
jgi:large subunit ribosomal protein L22